MTKAELIEKGKSLGVVLNNRMLKADMEKEIAIAEEKSAHAKSSPSRKSGEH